MTITGDHGELLLFAGAGREPARVSFDGDTEAIAAVQRSRRGLDDIRDPRRIPVVAVVSAGLNSTPTA